jgi:hypothetical protein
MADVVNYFFGPLNKEYCIYFYFLSIIGFISLVLVLVSSLFVGLSKKKGGDFYMQSFAIAIGYAIFYFQNRLLYSMCIGKA